MNAIERLRADHIDSGIALGHIDTDECTSSCVVCASLAAVEALYQASKETGQLPFPPVSFDERNEWRCTLGALAAAVRRVEDEA